MPFRKTLAVAVAAVCLSFAALPARCAEDSLLSIDLDATVVSRYMWRGYDTLADDPAFQPSATAHIGETGLSLNIWGSFALVGGWEELDELDYTAAYDTSLFRDEFYALDLGVLYTYFDFPKANRYSDLQEVGGSVALPNLLPLGNSHLVPSYYVAKLWPVESSVDDVEGWFHVFGLSYDLKLKCPLREGVEQTFSLSAETVYNSGAFGVDDGWSHAQFGLAVPVEIGPATVTPAIYYQATFEDTVNDDKDEFWSSLSLSLSF